MPPQQECRPPSSACLWVVAATLLLSVLAGGACLVLYVVLPPSNVPQWVPAAGLALVAFPWAFWLATCMYRCVSARGPAVERQASRPATVAPSGSGRTSRSASSASVRSGVGNASGKHDQSPSGARRVHFGNAADASKGAGDNTETADGEDPHNGHVLG